MEPVSTNFDSYEPLSVTLDGLSGRWLLDRPFEIIVEGQKYIVPARFDTDFSSYPWLTRNIVRFNRVAVAGTVHDYLYRRAIVSRGEADRIWRLIAQHGDEGASANPAQAWVSWMGLRLGGWVPWRKRRKKEA